MCSAGIYWDLPAVTRPSPSRQAAGLDPCAMLDVRRAVHDAMLVAS